MSILLCTLHFSLLKIFPTIVRLSSLFEIHVEFLHPVLKRFETHTDYGGSGEQRGVGPTTWTWDKSTLCVKTSSGLCPPPWLSQPGSEDGTFCSGETGQV